MPAGHGAAVLIGRNNKTLLHKGQKMTPDERFSLIIAELPCFSYTQLIEIRALIGDLIDEIEAIETSPPLPSVREREEVPA